MNIIGIGIDVIDWSRIAPTDDAADPWSDPFFTHTFSAAEQAEARASANPLRHFAGRFAVKEALIKAGAALGEAYPEAVSALRLEHIETLSRPDGQPVTHLANPLARTLPDTLAVHTSISHEEGRSVAVVLLEA